MEPGEKERRIKLKNIELVVKRGDLFAEEGEYFGTFY